jgi:1,4-alpha-glucan branching enzyme
MTKTCNSKTEFRFHRPGAQRVFLAGDFNDWDEAALPMGREPDGDWCCRIQLAGGVYQFRYYADDEWYTDYTDHVAYGIKCAPFGCNSVLVMPDWDLRGDAR